MKQRLGRCALAVILLDLALKLIPLGGQRVLVPGALQLISVQNHGVAFGLMQGLGFLIVPLSALAVVLGAIWLQKQQFSGFEALCYGLLLGGAVGNLSDRAAHGYVHDYLELLFVRFAVFNLADIALTLGAAMLLIYYLFTPTGRSSHAQ